jgi:hypothetical protein
MRRLIRLVLLLPVFAAALRAAPPVVRATATSPESPASLAPNEPLYVRVEYHSDQPLRFQAAGYWHGKKRERFSVNPSPVYPPGAGEAVVWFAGEPGAQVDEIRVLVHDQNWRPLDSVALPVTAAWHAGVARTPPAAWAKELSGAQQRNVSQDMRKSAEHSGGWFDTLLAILLPLAFLSVPGYPILQGYAFYRLRGPRRLISALPLSFMLPVYAFCLYALSLESNLWPLYAIFLSPVAFVIVWGVLWYNRSKPPAPPDT